MLARSRGATVLAVAGTAAGLTAVAVPTAAYAAPQQAAPTPVTAARAGVCDSWTDVGSPFGGVMHIPSAGGQSGNFACTLGSGNSGDGVYKLQVALNKCNGANLQQDSQFGSHTKLAVKAVQRAAGLPTSNQDGVYGPQTSQITFWPVMNPADNSFTGICQRGFFA
jgi:hypothetical protein